MSQALPATFVWGVSTSAFQIEGGVHEDGRGESIWDRFSHTPGRILTGENADTATDHYHRWQGDIRLMRDLGIDAYRFSIAWPRVMPKGTGSINDAGLGFYDRLVDGLLDAGIRPFPTLYHWDLPQSLEDLGGWTQRSTAQAFGEFAAVVGTRLGDRVSDWWTINEPWCVAELGYGTGEHAPGRSDPADALRAAHHVLLAHGLGVQALRATTSQCRVGIANHIDARVPRSSHPADVAAAELAHELRNRWYLDPVLLGDYPAAAADHLRWDGSPIRPGDMALISTPTDHLGLNYYTRTVISDPEVDDADRPAPIVEADLPRTTMGWEMYPQGLTDLLVRFSDDYRLPPTYISEGGAAFPDQLMNGAVHDDDRISYLRQHVDAATAAREAGVPLQGYFVWSLLDNFEWAHGYSQRFGLYWTDYETLERIPKDSARWYAGIVSGTR